VWSCATDTKSSCNVVTLEGSSFVRLATKPRWDLGAGYDIPMMVLLDEHSVRSIPSISRCEDANISISVSFWHCPGLHFPHIPIVFQGRFSFDMPGLV
jgi:hypothetical protein